MHLWKFRSSHRRMSFMKSLIKFFVKIFSYILFLLPRLWVRRLGGVIGFLWVDLFRIRRKVIFANMKIAYPEWPEEKRVRIGRESVYNMGHGFFEFFTPRSRTLRPLISTSFHFSRRRFPRRGPTSNAKSTIGPTQGFFDR